jgi:hypothetical protein
MTKYFGAADRFGVRTTQDMDPAHPGTRLMPGIMKASLSVYEPSDECQPHPSLPTLGELLEKVDPKTGVLTFDYVGRPLSMDAAPLLALPAEYRGYRVSPGCSFVTLEALGRVKTRGR